MDLIPSPEALAEARRHDATSGVRHRNEVEPLPPRPGRPWDVVVRVAHDEPIDSGRVVSEVGTVDLRRCETEGRDAVWRATMPACRAGVVTYRVEYTRGGETSAVADAGPAYDYPLREVPFVRPPDETFAVRVTDPAVPDWVADAVVYHVLVDRFARTDGERFPPASEVSLVTFAGGTLRGLAQHLDHVRALGANTLLLSPIHPATMHVCYDATDLFAVEPRLGTLDDVRALLREAHGSGMRVLLDLPLAYAGARHPSVRTHPERFRWHGDVPFGWFGSGRLVAVDHRHPDARREALDAVAFWRDLGFDGFRLDSAHVVPPSLWAQLAERVGTDAYLLGELMLGREDRLALRGRLHGAFDVDACAAIRGFLGERRVDGPHLDAVLHRSSARADGWTEPAYVENHDMARFDHLSGHDPTRLLAALTLLLSVPGPPILYYGTEVGMRQERADDLEHAREPMRWGDDQDADLLGAVRDLVAFRHAHPALRSGSYRTLAAEAGTIAFARELGTERVIVAANASDEQRVVHGMPVDGGAAVWREDP